MCRFLFCSCGKNASMNRKIAKAEIKKNLLVYNREQAKQIRFLKIPYPMIGSDDDDLPAIARLSGDAVKLFLIIAGQYNGINNGDLSAPLSKFEQYGFTERSLKIRLKELLANGFLVKTRQGGLGKCCLYAITTHAICESEKYDPDIRPRPAQNEWLQTALIKPEYTQNWLEHLDREEQGKKRLADTTNFSASAQPRNIPKRKSTRKSEKRKSTEKSLTLIH